MDSFLAFFTASSIFCILIMFFAFLLGQERKNKKHTRALGTLIGKEEQISEHSKETRYFFNMRKGTPQVIYTEYVEGSISLTLRNKDDGPEITICGMDKIQLLGAAIHHQLGSLSDSVKEDIEEKVKDSF